VNIASRRYTGSAIGLGENEAKFTTRRIGIDNISFIQNPICSIRLMSEYEFTLDLERKISLSPYAEGLPSYKVALERIRELSWKRY
jgi:hypothetical protein